MITQDNLESLTQEGHGYLIGVKRRRNQNLEEWLAAIDDKKWTDCPVGINARERMVDPPRTRAQEVPSGDPGMRVIIVDSDERRDYEQGMRASSMERAREQLQQLEERVASGSLKKPEKIGAAAERIMQRHHGYRYFAWKVCDGTFEFHENRTALEAEKRIEGKYVIATTEHFSVPEAVEKYKELMAVEQGFRRLKDVLAMRPIYHQVEHRVRAHIFVAALALLVQRFLEQRLQSANVDLSPERAMKALSTVRVVTFRLTGQPIRRGVTSGCPDARKVLMALKAVDLRPPSPVGGEETTM
jgi:transposase